LGQAQRLGCCFRSSLVPRPKVRNQRNRFVALIAAAGQAREEMGDRQRMLAAEADVLQREASGKAAHVSKVRKGYTRAHLVLRELAAGGVCWLCGAGEARCS
jgi:hypothetical protein